MLYAILRRQDNPFPLLMCQHCLINFQLETRSQCKPGMGLRLFAYVVITTQKHTHTQALLSTPHLISELSNLEASRVRLCPLLRVVTSSLVTRVASGAAESYEAPLLELIHSGLLEQVSTCTTMCTCRCCELPLGGCTASVHAL